MIAKFRNGDRGFRQRNPQLQQALLGHFRAGMPGLAAVARHTHIQQPMHVCAVACARNDGSCRKMVAYELRARDRFLRVIDGEHKQARATHIGGVQ